MQPLGFPESVVHNHLGGHSDNAVFQGIVLADLIKRAYSCTMRRLNRRQFVDFGPGSLKYIAAVVWAKCSAEPA